MCGIYAVVGQQAAERVFAGLRRLEYRGYDSWGVASLNGKKTISLSKQKGVMPTEFNFNGERRADRAMGHTRWATHGGVTDFNAHPHLAKDGSFALVQNGVVENYQELKKQLKDGGYDFVTETDTEVIVGLIEAELAKKEGSELDLPLVLEAFSQLEGRNTIGLLTNDGRLFAVRYGSPLIVARNNKGEWFFSSDTLSVAADASEYLVVNSMEAVSVEGGKLSLIDAQSGQAKKTPQFQTLSPAEAEADHDGFSCFMMKEIAEQGQVLSNIFLNDERKLARLANELRQAQRVYVLGAGSAYYAAGQIAYYLLEAGVDTRPVPAYEAGLLSQKINSGDLVIAVSQSGETADTNEVIELLKNRGVKVASIVNMAGSTLTALSDFPFMLFVGPEIAVASTKAFSAQVAWGRALSEKIIGIKYNEIKENIAKNEQKIAEWLADSLIQKKIRSLAVALSKDKDLYILGRGELYYAALESALKMKEISYVHAEGFSGGELKHGVIALVTKNTPVFCLIADDAEKPAMLNAAAEVAARGGRVIGIASEDNELFADWIPVPGGNGAGMIGHVLPFQLLTCHMALVKGNNPDKPRNLAKSVTVK